MTIALIDYGAGNLTSVRKGFGAAGAELVTPHSPTHLADCSGIVIPGVGHFAATSALDDGWREAIVRRVEVGVPLFGICLGMQVLFEGSEEDPEVRGLGLLAGRCRRIEAARPLKVPLLGGTGCCRCARARSSKGSMTARGLLTQRSRAADARLRRFLRARRSLRSGRRAGAWSACRSILRSQAKPACAPCGTSSR